MQLGNLGNHAATMTILRWWCGQKHKTHGPKTMVNKTNCKNVTVYQNGIS